MNNEAPPGSPDEPNRTPSLPSADTVKVALESAGCNAATISSTLWLLDHGRQHRISQTELAKLVRCDTSTLGRIFRGKYEGNYETIAERIEHFRKVSQERLDFGEAPIIATSVMQDVNALCDLARISATIAFLYGPNQSGKTTALRRYTEANNHGQTIFVRMPVGGSARMFLLAVAKACGISERNAYDQLRDRLLKFFTPTVLLIVDEVHQAMIGRSVKTVTVELIRELHDVTGCGVVLCGTQVLPEMMEDERMRKFFGQMDNRGVLRRRIPAAPPAKDIRAICRAYGLAPAEDEAKKIVAAIAKNNGIGKLAKYLTMTRKLAANRREPVSWDHFLTTHATLQSWARGDEEQEEGSAE